MTHPLLRPKRALDAVNEELLRPTEDPRAEQASYLNPWFGKGTEYNPDKQARQKRQEHEATVRRFRGSIRRKQAEIRLHAEGPAYYNIGNCVGLNGDSINKMKGESRAVSYREVVKNCVGVREWTLEMGYGPHTGMSITKDWAVSFAKSHYQGVPCYYIQHSAIEYVWTLNGDMGRPEEDEEDEEDDEPWDTLAPGKGEEADPPYRLASKRAIIKMHEDTKVLPPRNDMRSYLDDDIKKEMEEDQEDREPVLLPTRRRR